jgi:hypothetical protein
MKQLDITSLLQDHAIPYTTTGKNSSPGWINTRCCFCTDHSDHLGFNLGKEIANCRKCGWHPLDATIAALLGTNVQDARSLIRQYRTGAPVRVEPTPDLVRPNRVVLPGKPLAIPPQFCATMPKRGPKMAGGYIMPPPLKYLVKRGFTGDHLKQLIDTYQLRDGGVVGPYSHRIIAPVYFDGNLVAYQGRDYTGKATEKYKACPNAEAIRPVKDCLYGMDLAKGDTVVVVEGIVDMWKLGPGSVATFGTAFTLAQVRLLVERWGRRVILFDRDAKEQADKLANALSGFPGETVMATLDDLKDPGELSVEKGKEILQSLQEG